MSQTAASRPTQSPWPKPLRPAYDPLLQPGIDSMKDQLPEVLDLARLQQIDDTFGIDRVLKAQPNFDHEDVSVPGLEPGDADVTLTVFTPKGSTRTDRPCLYFVHGGGQVGGKRFAALDVVMGYFEPEADAVFVAVEYRIAPGTVRLQPCTTPTPASSGPPRMPPAWALMLPRSSSTAARGVRLSRWGRPCCAGITGRATPLRSCS